MLFTPGKKKKNPKSNVVCSENPCKDIIRNSSNSSSGHFTDNLSHWVKQQR